MFTTDLAVHAIIRLGIHTHEYLQKLSIMYAPEVDQDIFKDVQDIMRQFELSIEDYLDIKNALIAALRSGLKLRRREKSSVKMYPSYVTKMPNGDGKSRWFHHSCKKRDSI